jgi:maltose O-acetyltransferase
LTRWRELLRAELGVDWGAVAAHALVAPIPDGAAARLRTGLLRLAGLRIGAQTIVLSNICILGGPEASSRVTIGASCFLNAGCVLDATAPITIGDHVNFGHGVLITTSSHEVGSVHRRAGLLTPEAVHIGSGAWLASRVIVLPGVTVGEGAVVCAGAVVTRDVESNVMVGGVPARLIRRLDGSVRES